MAGKARETGLFAVLGGVGGTGVASMGAVRVTGEDASAFLHAQLTNEVSGLEPGEGNLTARVERTGHLVQILSLRRLPTDVNGSAAFLLTMEGQAVAPLREELEKFLFADEVALADVTSDFTWLIVQGPSARSVLEDALGSAPEMAGNALMELVGDDVPPGALLISQTSTGDIGFIAAVPGAGDANGALLNELEAAARAHGLVCPTGEDLSAVLDILRIEAGSVRVGPDTPLRDRLLPETRMEQQLVSYSKGCYLGQEVIARVRAHGSLPFELRGLLLEGGGSDFASLTESLENLPGTGEDLVLLGGGKIGQIVSRAPSPVMNAAVAMAYLDRAHRTPGMELVIEGRCGSQKAKVVLLPFYRSGGQSNEASGVYQHAVRVFADGQHERALALLERVITIDPTFVDAYEAIGVILGRAERFEEAIGIFERLEELAPEEPMVNTNLSLYYMKLGDKTTAEDHAARAHRKSLAIGRAGEGAEEELTRRFSRSIRTIRSPSSDSETRSPLSEIGGRRKSCTLAP
jgi:aminomethyltransferase